MEGFDYKEKASGVVAIDTAGEMLLFQPSFPVEIIRFGAIVTVATTVAASVLTADHEAIGGGALTPSGAAALGTVTVPVAPIGSGVYKEMEEPFLVVPGEQVQINTNGGSTAGDGIVWIHYRQLSFQASTISRHSADVITAPTADNNWLQVYTKVTA